jgi:hypothetical protein
MPASRVIALGALDRLKGDIADHRGIGGLAEDARGIDVPEASCKVFHGVAAPVEDPAEMVAFAFAIPRRDRLRIMAPPPSMSASKT